MEHSFLDDFVIVFGVAMAVVMVFSRLRLPSLVGFLLTGALVGPHGLELVHDKHAVELLAEVGVIVLLFTVGIEFSLGQLLQMGTALFQGLLQVVLTTAAVAGAAMGLGLAPGPAVLVGCVVALSSTAIVMRLLIERAETAAPHGRMSLGVLICQDLAVVPMILAIPFLGGKAAGMDVVGLTLLKAVGVIGGVLLVARKVVPPFLKFVVGTRSRELFLLSVIAICLGTAWLTAAAGLSLALGAFLAGLVVSESEYSHHAFSAVLPFQDAFSGLFFVSIGMLLDVGFIVHNPASVLGATVGAMVIKALVVVVIALLTRRTLRIGVLAGLLLCQIGEFSFLLLHTSAPLGVLTPDQHQLLIAMTVLTMALTPLAVRLAPVIAQRLADAAPTPGSGFEEDSDHHAKLQDHVIIVGFGVCGSNVARALRHVEMPYVVLELNAATVDRLKAEGEPALFGDSTQTETLAHAGIEHARVMVITVPDAAAARRTVQVALLANPAIHLIVRTRFVGEVKDLFALGAREVVPEEFETSIEIYSRVLRQYLVPGDVIGRLVRETRQEGYGLFRGITDAPAQSLEALLADMQLEVFRLAEESPLAGTSLAAADFKKKTGALVLAVRRGADTTANPPASWTLEPGDAVLVFGKPDDLHCAGELIRRGAPPPELDPAAVLDLGAARG